MQSPACPCTMRRLPCHWLVWLSRCRAGSRWNRALAGEVPGGPLGTLLGHVRQADSWHARLYSERPGARAARLHLYMDGAVGCCRLALCDRCVARLAALEQRSHTHTHTHTQRERERDRHINLHMHTHAHTHTHTHAHACTHACAGWPTQDRLPAASAASTCHSASKPELLCVEC